MFLNKEFLNIYEELSNLNEAKADVQKLINFAGEDLANRFLVIRNRLKAPENDLYYWIKNKTVDDLAQVVSTVENTKTATQTKKETANEGAELVCETEHWKVYHITTYEAARAYGRDTHWCITGINAWGDKYWNEYKNKGVDFYFLITKGKYDPRGRDSKFALAIYPGKEKCEVFDQKDGRVSLYDVKYYFEISIPGIDIESLAEEGEPCCQCGEFVPEGEGQYDRFDNCYCQICWDDMFE